MWQFSVHKVFSTDVICTCWMSETPENDAMHCIYRVSVCGKGWACWCAVSTERMAAWTLTHGMAASYVYVILVLATAMMVMLVLVVLLQGSRSQYSVLSRIQQAAVGRWWLYGCLLGDGRWTATGNQRKSFVAMIRRQSSVVHLLLAHVTCCSLHCDSVCIAGWMSSMCTGNVVTWPALSVP